jgi:hypothetical protein
LSQAGAKKDVGVDDSPVDHGSMVAPLPPRRAIWKGNSLPISPMGTTGQSPSQRTHHAAAALHFDKALTSPFL